MKARYVHTNLTAHDWRRLVRFYSEVFGCVAKPPERDLRGAWLDRLTGLREARLRGVHLALPGYGEDGPTLEIFSYDQAQSETLSAPNRPGFGHIAFAVDDIDEALAAVVAAGGSAVGDPVVTEVPGAGLLSVVYLRDPEGNIVEVQKWSHRAEPGATDNAENTQ